jgi:dipeptidyl aminopeptidase/acylaminoacyl peptidase
MAELARKLSYVDSLRMGILGHEHGAAITLQAIGRSNVFKAAVAVSPPVFSGVAENNFAGTALLRQMSPRLFGHELSDFQLRRELLLRDAFRFMNRIRSPLLMISTDQDPGYDDQARFVSGMEARGLEARHLRYEGLPADFLFSYDDGTQPDAWRAQRNQAWGEIFSFLETHIPTTE